VALTQLPSVGAHRGLTSETGQNNCFLNVIIQSLWHLASFREALLGCDPATVPAPGAPPADARVLTALRNIFRAFQQVRMRCAQHCTKNDMSEQRRGCLVKQ